MATRKPYIAQPAQTVDYDALIANLNGLPGATPEQEPSRGLLRGAADLGLEAASGAAKGIKFMSDVFGADNPVSQGLQGVSDFAKELQSAQARGEDQRIAQLMKEAEDKGIGEQVKAALRAAGEAPVRQAIGAIGTSVPMIAASMVPGLREASWGTRAAALGGMGGAQGVGVVKSSMYDAVYQRAIEEGRGEQEARALAQQAQAYSPENAGDIALGGALGVGAALTGFEPAAARAVGGAAAKAAASKTAQRGLMQSTLRGTLAEAIPEATQGFQEQVAGNRAEQRAGFDTPTFRGAAGSATLEGLLSAPGGAVGGALDARGTKPAPKLLADQIRTAESVPESGPMTRAANQAVEAKAQQVELSAAAEGAALAGMEAQAQSDLQGLRDFAGVTPNVVAGMPTADQSPVAEPGAQPSAEFIDSPFADRILTVQEMLADPTTRDKVRERWGDEGLGNIAYYLGVANRGGMPEKTQENLLGMAERLLQEAVLRPIQPAPELGGQRPDPLLLGSQPQPEAPALGMDTTPSGRFTVDSQGNAVPESRAQRGDAQRRADEIDSLGRQTPRGQAQPAATMQGALGIGMDTAPTGRLLAGQDGVRPETRMDAINIGQADMQRQAEVAQRAEMGLTPDIEAVQQRNAMRPLDGDILNPSGKPFKTLMAAQRAAKKNPGQVVEVTGGFAVRPATMVAAQPEVANDGRGNQDAAGLAEALAVGNSEAGDRAATEPAAVAQGEMLDAIPGQPAGDQPAQSDAGQGQRVGREGYDTPIEFDAASLKAVIEKTRGEPLATKPAKLEAWRSGTAKTDPAKYPIELAFTTDGRLDVNDGRHRIALAAERGEKVTAFIDGKDAQRAQELLANVQNLPQPASAQAPADQAPEAARGDGAAPAGIPDQGGAAAAVEAAGVDQQPNANAAPANEGKNPSREEIEAEVVRQVSDAWSKQTSGGFVVNQHYPAVVRVNGQERKLGLFKKKGDGTLYAEALEQTVYGPSFTQFKVTKDGKLEKVGDRNLYGRDRAVADQAIAEFNSLFDGREKATSGQQTSTIPSRADLAARAPLPKGDPEQAAREQAEMDGINALAGVAPAREAQEARPTATGAITADDVAAAEKQAAQMISDRIDAMTAQAAQKVAARYLPTVGVKAPVGKARIKAAMTDAAAMNLLGPAGELGIELSDSIKRALTAKMEGRVGEVAAPVAVAAPAPVQPEQQTADLQDDGDGWSSGFYGVAGTQKKYTFSSKPDGHWASVKNPIGQGYEIEYRLGDKVVSAEEVTGSLTAVKSQVSKRVAELDATQATHKDPGQPAETVTQPVIQAAMKKAARNEDTKPSEMRRWLLGEIDKALQQAPDLADYDATVKRVGEKDAVSMFTGNGLLGKNSEAGYVTFDVPGDGTFKVRNSVRGLLEFKRKVEASPGFKDRGQDRVKPEEADSVRRGSGGLMSAITNMIEEGDFEAARDYAEAVGVKLEDVKAPKDEKRAKEWRAFLKDGTLPYDIRMNEYLSGLPQKAAAEQAAAPQPGTSLQSVMDAAGWTAEVGGDQNTIWTKRANGEQYTATLDPDTKLMEVTVLVNGVGTQIASIPTDDATKAADQASQAVTDDLNTATGEQPPAQGGFDSAAFDKARNDTIRASRDAGNTHLDQVPAYVETMRGKAIFYVHDPKVTGVIRTVDNNKNVYVDWSNAYSAEKEMASPTQDGKKTVYRSTIGPRDLKDYALAPDMRKQVETRAQQASPTVMPEEQALRDRINEIKRNLMEMPKELSASDDFTVGRTETDTLGIKGSGWYILNKNGEKASAQYQTKAAAERMRLSYVKENPERLALKKELDKAIDQLAAIRDAKATEDKPAGKPIADFGEKIGGARKDVWTGFKDDLSAVADDDIAGQPLSKVWPAPDYQKLIDEGIDPEVVAFVRAARDEIPAKPRVSYKVKGWAEKVKILRGLAVDMMDGKVTKYDLHRQMEKAGAVSRTMQGFLGRVDLYQAVGHAKSLEGIHMAWHQYALYKGEKNVSMWVVEQDAKATAWGNFPRELATGKTKEEAIEGFRKVYDKLGSDKDSKKGVQFDIISFRGQKGYWIAKKLGRNHIKVHGPLETVQQAREYRDNHQADLVAKLEKIKEIPNERRETNEPRVGEDMRNGADVTPELFSQTFGFRGVEFGNWVEQGRRQQDLNNAFDALMDMAAVLGLPPKAISLNGQLGLAFGARGTGGSGMVAAAHYEPGKVVINLTKNRGAGSLGHEWWHAVDNYFAKMRKERGGSYMTAARDVMLASRDAQYMAYEGIRPEMVKAFGEVVKAINKTDMKTRSAVLDGKRAKEYWTTGEELSARSFEAYLISKLQDQNVSNDYLANIVREEVWNAAAALGLENENSYPYPTDKEVPGIRAAFDQFFQTVQTKEDDAGNVAMYRNVNLSAAAPGHGPGISQGELAQIVDDFVAKFAHKSPVVIADSAKGSLPGVADDDVIAGAVHRGRIHLFLDQIPNRVEAIKTLWHESLHYGLRRFLTKDQFISEMLALYRSDMWVRGYANKWFASSEGQAAVKFGGVLYARARGVDEALANIAEQTDGGQETDRITAKVFRAVTGWLAKMADKFGYPQIAAMFRGMNNAEAKAYVRSVFQKLQDDAPATTDDWTFTADPAFSNAAAKAYVAPAMDKLNETFNHPGKLSWWHKTVGSMYNLAERMPAFKPVYDAAQNFINDVSFYAIEAADKAPKLLPRLEDWKDLAKSPITAQDNKAVAAPVFEGTLSWRRDESGKPVLVEDLAKRYASLTPEQKAQRLLRANAISENVLKMWQGMPKDQYESSVNTAFEGRMLKAGIVFTPDELKSIFKLNDAQVALYQEFRQSIDTSLDNMGKSDLLRVAGKDAADLRDAVMSAPDVDAAAVLLRDHLLELAKEDPDRSDALVTTANDMISRAEKVQRLKMEGYAPLSRFGQYTVDVVVDGERQYFSMFETARDANRMAAKLKMEYGAENVAQGTLSQREFEMLQGITPESLELFGNMLGLDSIGNEAQDQVFQEYLKRTKANRSAMKRLIHRKGIAGYSEDVGRVLAAFVYSNARQTSAALHMGDLGEAVMAIPKGEGELKDAAVELARYVKEPREEAAKMRGWLFAQYLGGSIASAIVNFTQPLTTSAPYLSQFGGMGKSIKALYQAMADLKDKKFEAGLAESFRKRTEDGTLAPQGVHELMAQSRGEATLRTSDGTQMGDALAKGRNTLAKVMIGWGKLFGMAEQINRQSTYVAAYRMAVERGIADPDAFAKKAVDETQFVNNKANKMKFGRGAIGATLMTFKSYSLNWLELFHRLSTQNGREGKMAAAWMLGVLLLSAGASGLPFAEDAEDLADFLAQRLGYNWSSKKARQEFLESLFGGPVSGLVENGVTGLPGSPIDVSGRLGMSNLIPGTGLLLKKKDHTSDFTEVLGPAGDLAKRTFQAGDLLLSGNVGQAALTIAPKAIGNLEKGVDMAATGLYRDARGYKVDDATTGEAIGKAIGFQPRSVAQIQEASGLNQRAKDFYRLKVEGINAKWAKAIFEKDSAAVEEVRAELKRWNRQNPDQRIQANIPAILRRAKEMRKSKADRIADTAPKAMRASMREEVRKMQEEMR